MRKDLKALSASEMEAWIAEEGFEPYRGRQVRQWIFKRLARSVDEMKNLPKALRAFLNEQADLDLLETAEVQTSRDRTRKFLFRLKDDLCIESVLIPERGHWTLCISSQVGCAMGCRFCLTGRQGLKRNLTAGEIIEQVIQVRRVMDDPDQLTNIVYMGMGEPLANYDAVIRSAENLIADDGMNFSHRKVTLSTSGLAPQIRRLGKDVTVNLAVSLNAADDETRNALMPVNQAYPLAELLDACRDFPLPNRRRITFEYILIDGVNDRDRDARNLVRLLSGVPAKVNLIPLNATPELGMNPSPEERILRFQELLVARHFTAIIRKSKGQDILAACGQLSGTRTQALKEQEPSD
jgi:23S rRNA (adenine2503-C2)-methyltransferase